MDKYIEKKEREYINAKASDHIIKYVPVAGKQKPAELESFTNELVRRENWGNKDLIKQAVFSLADSGRISCVQGRDKKYYFNRYK